MCGLAISRFGLTSKEFYNMTPVEFYYSMVDYGEQVIQAQKMNWETTRFLALQVWNSAGKTLKRALKKPQDLVQFTWEKQEAQTVEDMKKQLIGIAAAFSNKKLPDKPRKLPVYPGGNKRSDGS